MKALSTSILIVVTAVVILVAALVVLTIFGGGVGNVSQIAEKRNNCMTQCRMTCETMNAMPPTWQASGCKEAGAVDTDCHCCPTAGQRWCAKTNGCAATC